MHPGPLVAGRNGCDFAEELGPVEKQLVIIQLYERLKQFSIIELVTRVVPMQRVARLGPHP